MSEHFPGAQAKIQEYITRIQNGEDKEFVLQGVGPAFRDPVEEALKGFEKSTEEIQEDVFDETVSSEMITQRKEEDDKKIEALRQELNVSSEPDMFEHKKPEWDDYGHQQAVGIYNTFMNIGKGLSEGLKEAFDPKVQQYVDEIKSGKSKDYVLSGAPASIVEAVEKQLAQNERGSTLEQKQQRESLEVLKEKLEVLSKEYYFLTHQTYVDFAEKINKEDFLFQGGGLNTTTLSQGPEGILLSLQKMEEGESHRNSDSMVIFAIPKKEFNDYSGGRKFGPDEFSEMLIDTKLEEISKSGSLRIPHEYVLGVYNKGEGFAFNTQDQ